ncbi:SpoIIE family protein phosphatase [Rapidithrix thailandica]|uniref:SpoIIE family protein phosphatase n=1 Tax=Rapidithrix thailandica TaxID=413964 RepID=A0AAW9RYY0_9BACT
MGEFVKSKTLGAKIIFIALLALLSISGYFILSSYFLFHGMAEKEGLKQLQSLANTSALMIDGDLHQQLTQQYSTKDALRSNRQDPLYDQLHQRLKNIAEVNELHSPIYTLIRSEDGKHFEFILTSSEAPYFRHSYEHFPPLLDSLFSQGGTLDKYESENGTWLSAFAPIRTSEGKVVAVVQVDQKFDEFIQSANQKLIKEISFSLVFLLLVGSILVFYLNKITKNEQQDKEALLRSYKLIEQKNKNISDSIQYAKRIQDALMPDEQTIQTQLPEAYMLFKGKDTVSGDFPWLYKVPDKNQVYAAAVDCTGHGVPGALLSIIGYFLLNDIIQHKKISEPGLILEELHRKVVETLKQNEASTMSNDGMDIALVKIDYDTQVLEFAGAHRPLVFLHNGELLELKGNKLPVGGTQYQKRKKEIKFTNHQVHFQSNDSIHLFSDGYQDQFGGPQGKKFMVKNLKSTLAELHQQPMDKVKHALDEKFTHWKGEHPQMDDVLVMGIRL